MSLEQALKIVIREAKISTSTKRELQDYFNKMQ